MSSNILFLNDVECRSNINIDDLYEKNMRRDLKQLSVFNKLLNRIHKRIQTTSKTKRYDLHTWFVVPTYLFGEPTYDQGECIAFLVTKLTDNGFHVKYIHPNTLYISWENWVPSYVRAEIKKKTGKSINEKGEEIQTAETDPNQAMIQGVADKTPAGKSYTPIDQYRPSGNLVYHPDMFHRIGLKSGAGAGGPTT